MNFNQIFQAKLKQQQDAEKYGLKISEYDKGFIDALILSENFIRQSQPQYITLYKDKIKYIEKEKKVTQNKFISVIQEVLVYARKNTYSDYCFVVKGFNQVFVFISKKNRHHYLQSQNKQIKTTLPTSSMTITVKDLLKFFNFYNKKLCHKL